MDACLAYIASSRPRHFLAVIKLQIELFTRLGFELLELGKG
jgi:hypothetical protein